MTMCMIDDAETFDVYSPTAWVCASKPHKCAECHRQIERGEVYRLNKGLYDGQWEQYRTCRQCCAGIDWLDEHCGGFLHRGVLEELLEHLEESAVHDENGVTRFDWRLARIIVGMRRQWRRFKCVQTSG